MAGDLGDHQRRPSTAEPSNAERDDQDGRFLRWLPGTQTRWGPRTADSLDRTKPGSGFCSLLATDCPPAGRQRLKSRWRAQLDQSLQSRIGRPGGRRAALLELIESLFTGSIEPPRAWPLCDCSPAFLSHLAIIATRSPSQSSRSLSYLINPAAVVYKDQGFSP